MKIYTRQGDTGTTALIGGRRVAKDDLRVEAYGTVDELGAHIACLYDTMIGQAALAAECEDLALTLHELMTASALLALDEAAPERIKAKIPEMDPAWTGRMESRIDQMSTLLPEAHYFTLPGGHPLISLSHICRTVCRRAERACVTAGREFEPRKDVLSYLNRLSDYFYVLGRRLAAHFNVSESYWKP